MSKGSVRRPENPQAIAHNWPLGLPIADGVTDNAAAIQAHLDVVQRPRPYTPPPSTEAE